MPTRDKPIPPYLSARFNGLSWIWRACIALSSLVVYFVLYKKLIPAVGHAGMMFSFLPVAVGGLLFGIRGGLLLTLLTILLNSGILLLTTDGTEQLMQGGLVGFVVLLGVGVLTGRLSDLYRQLCDALKKGREAEEELQESRELSEALLRSTAALSGTLLLDEVLERIVENVGIVVPHDVATILLREGRDSRIALSRASPHLRVKPDIYYSGFCIDEPSFLQEMVETGHPVRADDIWLDSRWAKRSETPWVRSFLGVPIHVKDQVAGFLNLCSSQPHFFREEHMVRLQAFADQASLALENARLFSDVQQNARRINLLNEITRVAIGAPDLRQTLSSLVDRLCDLFETEGACLHYLKPGVAQQESQFAYAPSEATYKNLLLEQEHEALLRSVREKSRIFLAENQGEIWEPIPGVIYPNCRLIGLPLVAGEEHLGEAILVYSDPQPFTPREHILVEQVAAQISLAVSKAELLEAERRRTEELARVNRLITALAHVAARVESAPDPDGVMESLGQEMAEMDMYCMVALLEGDGSGLLLRYLSAEPRVVRAVERLSGQKIPNCRFSPETFPNYEEVVHKRQVVYTEEPLPVAVNTLVDFPPKIRDRVIRLLALQPEMKAILLPLIAEEKVLGALWVWGRNLREADQESFSVFASQVAVALENARLYSEVQQLAITDPLTGLLNRRGLYEIGEREVERALRFNRPLSALMLDLDHFKRVNDQFGHLVGDDMLIEVASRCRENLREVDILGRYGGEEFLVLLPETDLDSAVKTAERLRRCFHGSPLVTRRGAMEMQVSIGVSTLPEGSDLEILTGRADAALYKAKQGGRNQVQSIE